MSEGVLRRAAAILLLVFACSPFSTGYSVLTHEQIVDLLWKDQIVPLLQQRFPGATEDDLREAHAYAYGGSVIQDMGYYPFGSKYFSDLLHYVRSGDFVMALIRDSSDRDEYAFALGALAHYASDNCGHPAINHSVAIDFPKLRAKYGDVVTYEDDPKVHIRTEFGFDMVQVAKNRYTSDRYHDFIGFQVSKPLLERAFQETYGMPLTDLIRNEDLAIGTFRRAVSRIIPEMTRVALLNRRKELVKDTPNFNEKLFLYHLSRVSYEKEWGKGYRRPGVGGRILAVVLKIIPKVGPFNALAFKIPNTNTEDMYIKSVNKTVSDYGTLLRQEKDDQAWLPNTDLDTGNKTAPGEYFLADKTYAQLLDSLAKSNFSQLTPGLQRNVVAFYSVPDAPLATKRKKKTWRKTEAELQQLKATAPVQTSPPSRAGDIP